MNEAAAVALGFQKPEDVIGKILKTGMGGRDGVVIGVVDNFHYRGLQTKVEPLIMEYVPSQFRCLSVTIKARTINEGLSFIKKTWQTYYPNVPFESFFLDEDFDKLGKFINSLDRDIPLHLSAYHPSFQMSNPRTPDKTLKNAYEIISQYINHIYIGNAEIKGCSHSYCHKCRQTLIERSWYHVEITGVDQNGHCTNCGTTSNIIFSRNRKMETEGS